MTRTDFDREMAGFRRQGIKYDLDRMRVLVDRLGHPERRYLTLHVAGTNGKGSTAAMLATALTAAGYRTGLNTSPHLVSFRERIRVDGAALPEAELRETLARLRPTLEEVEATFFETATVLAFAAFAEREVDVAVFEVGLGGRLDATNVITPVGGVITCVDLEHTKTLGETREAIAREKAGIIKGQPVVVAGDDPDVLGVLAEIARERSSLLIPVNRGSDWTYAGGCLERPRSGKTYEPALAGEHQAGNAALALTLLEHLDRTGALPVPETACRAAVERVRWPGRFDVRELCGATVVFDVAHNPSGARVLAAAVAERYAGRRVALVLGMLRDKAHAPFLEAIAPITPDVTVVTPGHEERRLEAVELAVLAARAGIEAVTDEEPTAAVRAAARRADVVVVTGSLFTVGDAMAGLGVSPADELLGLDRRVQRV